MQIENEMCVKYFIALEPNSNQIYYKFRCCLLTSRLQIRKKSDKNYMVK